MKILIAGGTGLVGRIIIPALIENSNKVTVLTRHPRANMVPPEVRLIGYDPYNADRWQFEISNYDAYVTGEFGSSAF
jgi:NAD dependent epimerase/dehydratase family enzyme